MPSVPPAVSRVKGKTWKLLRIQARHNFKNALKDSNPPLSLRLRGDPAFDRLAHIEVVARHVDPHERLPRAPFLQQFLAKDEAAPARLRAELREQSVKRQRGVKALSDALPAYSSVKLRMTEERYKRIL